MTQEWFTETEDETIKYNYALKKKLSQTQSKFQSIDVVETKAYGKMLILDGYVMLSDFDEFVYHEMIAHIPALYHQNPKKALVIGGGDGGTVRELLKHECIEEITLCEIDREVVNVSKKYFPKLASGIENPKVKLNCLDGIAFIETLNNELDIIIIDSTDPVGPGEGLFTETFYQNVSKALKKDGIMVAQSESPWAEQSLLKRIYNNMKQAFPTLKPYIAPIPTYPRGLWSWTLGTKGNTDLCFSEERFKKIEPYLEYLTKTNAKNIFDIPPFYRKKLH